MDGSRFDHLARWAATTSRRRALRFLVGFALGGLLPSIATDRTAGAACGLVGDSCTQDGDCCPGARCARNGTCRCKLGLTACGGRCRNLQTNPNHCGACGHVCASGSCVAGVCCPAGQACDGACCPLGATCVRSPFGGFACVQAQTCPPGQTRCFDRCVDLADPPYCGNCLGCPLGETCCGGRCVDVKTSHGNCGGCGNACAGGQTCCGGFCVDTRTHPSNCGACGVVCPDREDCWEGRCLCPADRACGAVCCPRHLRCIGGQCVFNGCPAGTDYCDFTWPLCHAAETGWGKACFCYTTTAGHTVCTANTSYCYTTGPICAVDADCEANVPETVKSQFPTDWVCVPAPCFTGQPDECVDTFCAPLCPTPAPPVPV